MSPAAKERDKERRRLAKQRRRQRMTLEERTAHNRRKRERMSPERRKRRNRVQHMNKHPHLYYRGARCEMCGFVPEYDCQLDVDHIDGDRNNNDPLNLQTLCANCHRAKTHEERDHLNSYDGEQAVDDGQTDLFDGD